MKKKMHYGFMIVIAIFAQYFIGAGIFFGASGMFIVPVTESLGIGQGQFTMYMTIQNIAMAICTIFAAKLLAKYDIKRLNTLSALIAPISLLCMAFAKNIAMFYIGGALAGISLTFLTFLAPGTLLPRWFNEKLGTMLGIASSASAIGGIVLNPLINRLLNTAPLFAFGDSWRSAYVILAIVLFAICFPAALIIQNKPEDKGLKPYGEAPAAAEEITDTLEGVSKDKALKSLSFVLLLVMETLWAVGTMILSYLPAYASTSSVGASTVGIIGSVAMAGSVVGGFIVGSINDKSGGHIGALFCCACGILGFILLLVGKNSVPLILAGALGFGLFYCIGNVQLPAMVKTLYGNKDYSSIFPVAAIIAPWAGAVSSSLWGFLYDATKSYVVMIVCGMIMCVSIAVLGLLAKGTSKKLNKI